jgi:pyruvate dehydrogenase E2 component (dihydrolipoamide acetyltransferase)
VTSVLTTAHRPGERSRHRHTPRVRRLATEHGLDLADLVGIGPSGRVRPDDVLAAARRPTPSAPPTAAEPVPAPSRPGSAISVLEVEVTAAQRVATGLPDQVGLLAVVTEALVAGLRAQPALAAHGDLVVHTAGERTVLLTEAGDLAVSGIARRLAAADGVPPTPVGSGPVSLTDATARGTLWEAPVLAPGQVLALALCAVSDRPVVVTSADGGRGLAIRPVANLVLVHDSSLVDGAAASALLVAVRTRLELVRPS